MSETQDTYTEQPAVVQTDKSGDALITFLGIGIVVNLVLVTAYFAWARKQWKKTDRDEN